MSMRRLMIVASVAVFIGCSGPQPPGDYEHLLDSQSPQYGGDLNIGTVYVTLSPLSWDPADWSWKLNHDTGAVREQLFAADLTQAIRNGGEYNFRAEAYIPDAALRGELAEHWTWEDDLTLVVHLREGIMFPAKAGVMAEREFTAEDVLFTYDYINSSAKRIATYFEHIDQVEVRDRYTVVFHFNQFNAEWAYRFGYGYYSGIVPREIADVDPKSWRNLTGSGPFTLDRYVQSNSQTYARNPDYWDSERVDDKDYDIPFIDSFTYRIIKDEATFLTALRTGKLDILEGIRWIAADHLRETTPELKWMRSLGMGGTFMVMRPDREPFDDPRVRRAINLAVNQPEIVEQFYGGHAELMAYPQHPDFGDYYQPLEEMPASVQELFTYDPDKARALLAEADGEARTVPAKAVLECPRCPGAVSHVKARRYRAGELRVPEASATRRQSPRCTALFLQAALALLPRAGASSAHPALFCTAGLLAFVRSSLGQKGRVAARTRTAILACSAMPSSSLVWASVGAGCMSLPLSAALSASMLPLARLSLSLSPFSRLFVMV